MAFSYGLTFPAAFLRYQSEEYPDLFKFYTAVPTRSTESSAANKRRPVLFTSMNGGVRWKYESASTGFYQANYCGNFYFDALNEDADHGILMALAHKSASSSYGSYKARGGLGTRPIRLGVQGWETSTVVAYNTANQPNREICKNLSTSANQGRYFCIKEGGGFAYNNTAWGTANWTSLNLPSNTALNDDGGFRHICINPEKDHEALIYLTSSDTNKYLRFYLFNTNDLAFGTDYTATIWGDTTHKQANYKYSSIGYLPGIGYLIFYCYGSDNNWCVKRLLTHDLNTGEPLPYNQYVLAENIVKVGTFPISQYGSHGWYCPWTKEYYFVPSARQVFWTKDGLNWNSSTVTGASTSAVCQKFLTDGQSMVIATSGSAFYYSRDKGQGWVNDYTVSPNCFNTARSTDTIVIPFKCVNNIGLNTNNILIGQHIDGSGNVEIEEHWFQTNYYIPVDPDTSYVFYGSAKEDFDSIAAKQKTYYNQINYYDSNYNWISRKEGADYDKTNNREVPCLFTSPSNAAYAVLCSNVNGETATQSSIDKYKWYFAKETDFQAMTNYGNIVCD